MHAVDGSAGQRAEALLHQRSHGVKVMPIEQPLRAQQPRHGLAPRLAAAVDEQRVPAGRQHARRGGDVSTSNSSQACGAARRSGQTLRARSRTRPRSPAARVRSASRRRASRHGGNRDRAASPPAAGCSASRRTPCSPRHRARAARTPRRTAPSARRYRSWHLLPSAANDAATGSMRLGRFGQRAAYVAASPVLAQPGAALRARRGEILAAASSR